MPKLFTFHSLKYVCSFLLSLDFFLELEYSLSFKFTNGVATKKVKRILIVFDTLAVAKKKISKIRACFTPPPPFFSFVFFTRNIPLGPFSPCLPYKSLL